MKEFFSKIKGGAKTEEATEEAPAEETPADENADQE